MDASSSTHGATLGYLKPARAKSGNGSKGSPLEESGRGEEAGGGGHGWVSCLEVRDDIFSSLAGVGRWGVVGGCRSLSLNAKQHPRVNFPVFLQHRLPRRPVVLFSSTIVAAATLSLRSM